MVGIPGKNFQMLNTEVTQKTYTSIMGSNPSYFKGENNPVERVSWYDAIYFCNKLSEKLDLTPVYAVNGKTDVAAWEYAANGGQYYRYSGSDNLDEVGWYKGNSGCKTHPVAQKKANGYGLYDMSGNVWEWCWDVYPNDRGSRYCRGGSYDRDDYNCEVSDRDYYYAGYQYDTLGFRIVRSASK